jgi:hypothetical protein
MYHEWLEQHGESLHDVAIYVDSLDDAIRSIEGDGYGLIQCGRGICLDDDGGFAYFDTESELGLLLEVVEPPARRREPELVIP